MYFRPTPVERPEELFDREEEVKALREAVGRSPMVVVVGVRRVGKTSLVKAATFGMRGYTLLKALREEAFRRKGRMYVVNDVGACRRLSRPAGPP